MAGGDNGTSVLLLRQKHVRIILALRDKVQEWHIASLAKASDTTYVHAFNFVAACERAGIVSKDRHGRRKVIKLTEKGTKIAELLDSLQTLLAGAGKEHQNGQAK